MPSNDSQQTHIWRPYVNHWNVDFSETRASVDRAQQINYTLAAMTPGTVPRDLSEHEFMNALLADLEQQDRGDVKPTPEIAESAQITETCTTSDAYT